MSIALSFGYDLGLCRPTGSFAKSRKTCGKDGIEKYTGTDEEEKRANDDDHRAVAGDESEHCQLLSEEMVDLHGIEPWSLTLYFRPTTCLALNCFSPCAWLDGPKV
jgi:hypothetical protein